MYRLSHVREPLAGSTADRPRHTEGLAMVAVSPVFLEWMRSSSSYCRPATDNRCLPAGLGRYLQRYGGAGMLEHKTFPEVVILSRTYGSVPLHAFICHSDEGQNGSDIERQHSVVAYINFQGGPSADLIQVAATVWSLVFQMNISLAPKYVPGRFNRHRDYLSRIPSNYEWKLHPRLFADLEKIWGLHTIDRFYHGQEGTHHNM